MTQSQLHFFSKPSQHALKKLKLTNSVSKSKILNNFLTVDLNIENRKKNYLPNDITPMACTAFGFANAHAFSDFGLKQTFVLIDYSLFNYQLLKII